MMTVTMYHNPVLLHDAVNGLNIKKKGIYVDATFGGGGHSKAILNQLGTQGRLIAFDQDTEAIANRINDSRFNLLNENFKYLKQFLKLQGVLQIDGLLADFGVSSHQFDVPERGFSTRFNSYLDMRMNRAQHDSAYHIVNTYDEFELRRVFKDYGELKQAPLIARTIISERHKNSIETTEQLKNILKKHLYPKREHKILAQIYQAIRIEVNQELEAIKLLLNQLPQLIKKGGRISIISYHSLEDRLVKRFIRNGMFEGEPEKDMFGHVEVPFKKIGKLIIPKPEEIKQNNRARSAKLRIAERI